MKKYRNLIFVVSIAAVMPACGKKAPEKVVPAAALDRYATEFVKEHQSELHGHSAPIQTLESPVSFVTQFFTTKPAMLTANDKSSYDKNIGITEQWKKMYCTDTLQKLMKESGIAIASAQLIDSSTGQKHSLVSCVSSTAKGPPATLEVATKFTPSFLSSGMIDPKFKGASPSNLVSSLEGLQDIKKGEFEKTEDFNKRKANALSVKLIDDYGVEDVFPLVIDVSKYSTCLHGIMYGYNPDTSKATLHLSAYPESYGDRNFISGYDSQKYDTFELGREYQKDRTYVGSNAFGVQANVTEVEGVIYTIASKKIDFVPGKRTLSCFEKEALFKFSMDAETAAKELPTLKALIMLKVKPPYVLYRNFHQGATRSDLTETKVMTKALYGDVVGIVIYSGTTGKIVTRFPLTKK